MPLAMVNAGVTPEVEVTGADMALVDVSVNGHTVVDTAMIDICTEYDEAGQLVTFDAQLVMVTSLVE